MTHPPERVKKGGYLRSGGKDEAVGETGGQGNPGLGLLRRDSGLGPTLVVRGNPAIGITYPTETGSLLYIFRIIGAIPL